MHSLSFGLFCFLYFATIVFGQSSTSYSHLPSAALYSAGAFLSPDGPTQVFTEGARINITWDADFSPVNLWLIRGQDWTEPIGIQLNFFGTYTSWKIDGGKDLSEPFVFRIVRANGTLEQQTGGGFLSERFWIASNGDAKPTSSLSATQLTGATSPTISVSRKGGPPATGSPKHNGGGGGGLSTGAEAGIGVGVGLVGIALVAGFGYFFWRRRHNQQQNQNQQPRGPEPRYSPVAGGYHGPPPPRSQNQYYDGYSSPGDQSYQPWPSPAGSSAQPYSVYAHHAQGAQEMRSNELRSPVEAPTERWREPAELEAERYSKPRSPAPIQPWDGREAR